MIAASSFSRYITVHCIFLFHIAYQTIGNFTWLCCHRYYHHNKCITYTSIQTAKKTRCTVLKGKCLFIRLIPDGKERARECTAVYGQIWCTSHYSPGSKQSLFYCSLYLSKYCGTWSLHSFVTGWTTLEFWSAEKSHRFCKTHWCDISLLKSFGAAVKTIFCFPNFFGSNMLRH